MTATKLNGCSLISSSDAKMVASASSKSLCSVNLAKGEWLLFGTVMFQTDSTSGRRGCVIGPYSDTWNDNSPIWSAVVVPPASNAYTYLHTSCHVSVSQSTTYYLVAYQNVGWAVSCTGSLKAVRVG